MEGLGWISPVLFQVSYVIYSAISGFLLSRWVLCVWKRHRYFQMPTPRMPEVPPYFGRMIIYAAFFFVSMGLGVGSINQLLGGNLITELISTTFIVGGLLVILMVVAESIKKRIESKKTKGSD